jgi:hypothetical protein
VWGVGDDGVELAANATDVSTIAARTMAIIFFIEFSSVVK